MTDIEKYKKFGFLVIENVFDEEEIKVLRDESFKAFDNLNKSNHPEDIHLKNIRQIYNKRFIKNPSLVNPLLKEKLVNKVREIMGENYIQFFDFSLTNNNHSPSWHTDSQSLGFSTKFLYHKNYNIAKLGLYLQEDDQTYGGQLDIIPCSHKPSFLGVNWPQLIKKRYGKVNRLQLLAMRVKNKLLTKVRVKAPLGSVILFHGLLLHRSSQPNWKKLKKINLHGIKDQPDEKRKFMFQWEVSENNEFANFYSTHQSNTNKQRYQTASKLILDDFSKSSISLIKSNRINLKSYSDLALPLDTEHKTSDGIPIIFPNV